MTRSLTRGATLSAADAFLLYRTYGFPLDLVQVMTKERVLQIDSVGFDTLLTRVREESQAAYAAKKGEGKFVLSAAAVAQLQSQGVATTDDSPKYLNDELEAVVRAIWKGNAEHGSFVQTLSGSDECGVVLDRTNFYAERGGQVFDSGVLISVGGVRFVVRDTQVFGGYVAHIGSIDGSSSSTLKVGDRVACNVNNERRVPIMSNHTGTHLLNHGLRLIINPKAEQRGSIVTDEQFRFDFVNGTALTRDQLAALDAFVNERIA